MSSESDDDSSFRPGAIFPELETTPTRDPSSNSESVGGTGTQKKKPQKPTAPSVPVAPEAESAIAGIEDVPDHVLDAAYLNNTWLYLRAAQINPETQRMPYGIDKFSDVRFRAPRLTNVNAKAFSRWPNRYTKEKIALTEKFKASMEGKAAESGAEFLVPIDKLTTPPTSDLATQGTLNALYLVPTGDFREKLLNFLDDNQAVKIDIADPMHRFIQFMTGKNTNTQTSLPSLLEHIWVTASGYTWQVMTHDRPKDSVQAAIEEVKDLFRQEFSHDDDTIGQKIWDWALKQKTLHATLATAVEARLLRTNNTNTATPKDYAILSMNLKTLNRAIKGIVEKYITQN